ncbi:DMT family transporter [Nocardiopsis flavescens]|uniref:Permease of the drug/metabolite transporter (DMT) superfamily n=1 Tax=Nocardiopsis flavescens TaxID=758803 RepID=A0A1M6EW83_9ACTN|nr:DMT family transporter [Nocardiopsis flavescens]SHI89619.1 Permease of the drug/metabolite transporter (DMT) superfamily [Nocardiopsis flavescens]
MSVLSPSPAASAGVRRASCDWRLKFALLALIWGMSFVFIKVAAQSLEPMQLSLGRIAAGALPLLAVVLLRGGRLPASPRLLAHMFVAALLLNTVPFTLFGYAAQLIPSAVMGIVNAATPLFGVVFSMMLLADERRPDRDRVLGLAVGFVGVLVVFGVWNSLGEVSVSDRDAMVGMGFVVAATACYGIGTPYLRRFVAGSSHGALELSALQLLLAAVPLVVLVPVATDAPTGVTWQVVASVLVLGVLGTGVAYVLQYAVLREAGATVATTVTYVAPVVSIAAGIVLMGETLVWNQPLGALVIIVGAALCQGLLRTRPVAPPSRG